MNKPEPVPTYLPEQTVKSCKKLEAGLRFGQEGVAACALGPFQSPIYWTAKEAAQLNLTKDMIIERRKEVFDMLNDDHSETPCKQCQMVYEKPFKEVDFTKLGHIDFSETSMCNIRCDYCHYTKTDSFNPSNFDSLAVLKHFNAGDVLWDAAVDFGGGEPTILKYFDDSLAYFKSRGIRVYLYTNAVKFSQAAYNGLVDGSISWLCVSLDCGTPSTYESTKLRNYFPRVMDSLFKYVEASKKGLGHVSVKYIFTEHNCGDDDLYGFTYAMQALQPDKIWLTFDFEPTKGLSADEDDFGEFDYTKLVEAYVKLFVLLRQAGMNPGHFEENHLSQVSRQGQILLTRVRDGVAKAEEKLMKLKPDAGDEKTTKYDTFTIDPLSLIPHNGVVQNWDIAGKKVLIAPVSNQSVALAKHPALEKVNLLGFVDRDPILQSKQIDGYEVIGYSDIKAKSPEVILLAVHHQHRDEIIKTIEEYVTNTNIVVME